MEGNMIDRISAEVFPPGEFLRDELDARGWTQTEFAEIIGRPHRLVNELIAGKRGITPETAKELAAALGTSAQFWMNLDSAYQLSKVAPATERIAREAALRDRFPVREMTKRRWIGVTGSYEETERRVLKYFCLRSVDEQIHFPHAARRDYGNELLPTQWAWLFRVQQLGAALQTAKYSEQKLRDAAPDLERLMLDPEEIRHVPRILSECGVRLIIVEPIPGSKIQGVCFWIDKRRSPVIGLSLKGDQIDRFWFDLWHEIEHVLRGDGRDEPVLDDFDDPQSFVSESEKAANEAAANHCVPSKAMKSFILRHSPLFSERNLLGFSKLMKRHPGIVAGQIQKQTNRWDLFKKHQVKIRHILTAAALTDGYGRMVEVDLWSRI
jgi:HTH-type transcriptional regulator / antitoxin HigA